MKSRTFLALAALAFAALFTVTSRAEERRFSATLNPAESTQSGLSHLNSDQVAVLDALVRNDINTAEFQRQPRPELFSQRLSDNERRNAGFALLTTAELAQLDASVARFAQPVANDSGPSTVLNSPTRDRDRSPTEFQYKRKPEIHGSVTLMVAGGSGGYSAYGGAIDLTYFDPAHNFAISVGYSEVHSSGGYGNRRGFRRFAD